MDLKSILKPEASTGVDPIEAPVPLGGTRAEALKRLQIGLFGLGAVLFLIGIANVFLQRANLAEEAAVPEAAPTVAADEVKQPQSDPLADAGVVPELPADPDANEQPADTTGKGPAPNEAGESASGGAAQP